MGKDDNLELAEEHVKIAEQLLNEEAKKCQETDNACTPEKKESLLRGQLDLEKAEAEIEEAEQDSKKE